MQVSLTDASEELVRLVQTVLSGEEVIILRGDRPIVKLAPIEPVKRRPQFGSAKGLITISDDFDEPLEDFKDYME